MSRRLQIANLIGVLVLVVLCVVQWRRDRNLNLEVIRLENLRQSQEKKLADQAGEIRGVTADLAGFKERFSAAQTDLTEWRQKYQVIEKERDELANETRQLKETLTNWVDAVKVRDERLKEANERIGDIGTRLNDSVRKFNELATNYNKVVAELNATRATPPPAQPK